MSSDPRIFVSYSRKNMDYAVGQRARIEAESLTLWQDVTHMEGGNAGGWWDQIKERLEHRATEHMVLFVSTDSLASGIVADEWRLARRNGVEVHLVKVPDKLSGKDIGEMPAGLSAQHFYDLGSDEQFNRLIAALQGPSRQLKAPMMAPVHDEHFVLREEESNKLIASLLRAPEPDAEANSKNGRAVGITAALRGAGGYGKTQLARWLCQQERIVDHFYDGMLWVELGETPDTTGGLQGRVEHLIKALRREITDEDRGFPNATAAAKRLFELLEKGGTKTKGRYLLVIDDAWRKSDVDLFMGGAPNTVRLVTTRLDDTLPLSTDKIAVDAMKPAEAVELLAVGLDRLGVTQVDIVTSRAALTHLAGLLGEWALLLTLANGQLRSEIEVGLPLPEALRFVERIYDGEGLTAFDPEDETQRSRVAALSIGASLRHLTPDEIARFEDLAIFPEDEHIPVATMARLWARTGGLNELHSQQLLRKLKKYALLMSLDLASGTARLHDVMRKYLRDRIGPAALIERHKTWLAAYDVLEGNSLPGPEQLYYYLRRPLHLAEAGERAALDALLLSPAWMQQKLAAFGTPQPLIEDYRAYAPYDPANITAAALVGRTLSLSTGALSRDERQLVPHLLGRLRPDMAPGMGEVIAEACRELRPPALIPKRRSLTKAGSAQLWSFEGHGGPIISVAFSTDGTRIVSSSHDNTVRLWNAASGSAIGKPLEGHEDWVSSVAFSPDGSRIVSGSWDKSILLWDTANGEAIGQPLEGHGGTVNAVAFSPDGARIVSGSLDRTVRLWDATSGAAIGKPLEGHGSAVNAVAFSPDGARIVSGSSDRTLRLWDATSGAAIGKPLEGHGSAVNAVAISPDGARIVSGSSDRTLRLWDQASGVEIREPLEGHDSKVSAVAFSPDGKYIVSGSWDSTVRLWDAASGVSIGVPLDGHDSRVNAVAFSPDATRIVSGSHDNTLRLCDVARGAAIRDPLESHDRRVSAVIFSPDGTRIVSGSDDNTLRLWDVASGAAIGRPLEGHCGSITGVAFSPDGKRIVSGSRDDTLRLWDAASGTAIGGPLKGSINALAFSPDGKRILSGSRNSELSLWDVASGVKIGPLLLGRGNSVNEVGFSPDGARIVSCYWGNMLGLWDAAGGDEIGKQLEGHCSWVSAVAFSPDGARIVSGSSDKTLRLWDATTGEAIGQPLEGHGGTVNAVAFSPDGARIVSGSLDRTLRLWDATSGAEIARFEGDAAITAIAVTHDTIAAGDLIGRVHILGWIPGGGAKAAWLARFGGGWPVNLPTIAADGHIGEEMALTGSHFAPVPPPADITAAPPEMQVAAADLPGARHLETYRGRHLFMLADGRIYIDGLIAVSSLDQARATLDHMARQSNDA